MQKKIKIFLCVIALCFLLLSTAKSYAPNSSVFVKVEKENLRDSPNGTKIGELLQATNLTVVEEQGDWVKVEVTGWIYKPSLTDNLSDIEKPSAPKSYPAGNGFHYSNVTFRTGFLGPECLGEMTNKSGKNYQIANFIISVYDKNGRLLETAYINISNISNGATKSFNTYFLSSSINDITTYKIQYENGF